MRRYISHVIFRVARLATKQELSGREKLLLLLYRGARNVYRRALQIDSRLVSRQALLLRQNFGGKLSGSWTYVSLEEASIWTMNWVSTFPEAYDLIVGVPRSGLFVASMIALKLGKPLATPETLVSVVWKSRCIPERPVKSVLLVDDSVASGNSMRFAKDELRRVMGDTIKITTAALITSPGATHVVDLSYRTIDAPRIFEWNMLHARKGIIAVDMDGVLCEEPPVGVEAEEHTYRKHLQNARPYLIPAFCIDAIVTNRLEKYRKETEAWLREHQVKYKELVMWDLEHKDERRVGLRSRHKSHAILRIKPIMFWESGLREAGEIYRSTSVPVWCVGENILLS